MQAIRTASALCLCLVSQLCAQSSAENWKYKVDQNGVRVLFLESTTQVFGKEVPVMLRLFCRPTKGGGIGLEFVIGKIREIPEFDFESFDEHRLPSEDRDIEVTITTPSGPISYHAIPSGWDSVEIPGGFTFSHLVEPVKERNSIPRKMIHAMQGGATGIRVVIKDKQQPGKILRANFSLQGSQSYLKALTEGLP